MSTDLFAPATSSGTPLESERRVATGESSGLVGVGGVLRVLVACEYSGAVRDAFRALGHDAMSCDLLPTDAPGPHHTGDVIPLLSESWDMVIAFPPCTHLCVSGAKHFAKKRADGRQQQGIDFFIAFANAKQHRIAIENPVGIMSSIWREPDQIIQPWHFGDSHDKTTCLWLKNLPPLIHSAEDDLFYKRTHVERGKRHVTKSGKSLPQWYQDALAEPDTGKARSKTFQGIADAMAAQWSAFVLSARVNSQVATAATHPGAQLTLNIMPTAPASVRIMPKTSALKLSKKMVPCGEYGVAADFTGGGGAELVAKDSCDSPKSPNESILMQ